MGLAKKAEETGERDFELSRKICWQWRIGRVNPA
jgi:hypothetical protein